MTKKNKCNKRGITLVELVVSLMLTGLIFSIVLTSIIGVNQATTTAQDNNEIQDEFSRFENTITTWYQSFDDIKYSYSSDNLKLCCFKFNDEEYYIAFDEENKILEFKNKTGKIEKVNAKHIVSIEFRINDKQNLSKWVLKLQDTDYIFVLDRKSVEVIL